MFWRFVAPKYAFKDFKSHMNMQNHQTLKGLIRRLARKYPKAYRAVQQTLLFSTVYALAMTLIPGSELPFQKPIKVWLLATYLFVHTEPVSFQSYGFTTCLRLLREIT